MKTLWYLALGLWAGGGLASDAPPARVFDFSQLKATDVYTAERGFGFDRGTTPSSGTPRPFFFSVAVPEGSYRVTVAFGDATKPSETTLRAESRQLLLERLSTAAGQFETRTFIVNIRTPALPPPPKNAPGGSAVLLNPRETGLLRWDQKLTLEFGGAAPRIRSVAIEPAAVPVVFLAGDSTVTDQPAEPTASWGQMLPRFFKPEVAVANHAESGPIEAFHRGERNDIQVKKIRVVTGQPGGRPGILQ